jgi:hypothetical protein
VATGVERALEADGLVAGMEASPAKTISAESPVLVVSMRWLSGARR